VVGLAAMQTETDAPLLLFADHPLADQHPATLFQYTVNLAQNCFRIVHVVQGPD